MARRLEHVRFRLTDLIRAAQKAQGLNRQPTTQQALTFYWNWVNQRGWHLHGMTSQIDPNTTILAVENTTQMELRNEEFWNVIWSGEDTDGGPNLVEEMGVSELDKGGPVSQLEQNVIQELHRRGWETVRNGGAVYYEKPGWENLDYLDLAMACSSEDEVHDNSVLDIADDLEGERQ